MSVDLHSSWSIGSVEIPTRLVLAPMAGVSVQAFRRQGRRFGAGLVCSEMVSCAGLSHGNERTLGYLRIGVDEHPLAVQIFGSEAGVMAEAARMVEAAGADLVDINFGCPVRKVTKTGAGATLLEDPDRACRVVEHVAGAVDVPVSVKMRRGLEDGSRAALTIGPRLVDAGAASLTLPGLRSGQWSRRRPSTAARMPTAARIDPAVRRWKAPASARIKATQAEAATLMDTTRKSPSSKGTASWSFRGRSARKTRPGTKKMKRPARAAGPPATTFTGRPRLSSEGGRGVADGRRHCPGLLVAHLGIERE